MIGKTISHYKIIEKLGAGGMGVVYKAEDTKLKRLVALKFLPPLLSVDEEAKKRFIHEAQAASALEHPNICNIHEIDETDDGQLFIVMACYEGQTLKGKLSNIPLKLPSKGETERSPLLIDETIEIGIQIAAGLAKAHEKGIVHRDIKPANILITADGAVKILDFGLAKLSTHTKLTKEGTTIGTVAYMSPEQARGADVDQRSDIWSLGVILYEMITGRLPFQADYDQAIIYSIINEVPKPISDLLPEIPSELERILIKCLDKDPSKRYQQSGEIIVDMQNLKKMNESEKSQQIFSARPIKKGIILSKWYLLIMVVFLLSALGYFLIFHDKATVTSEKIRLVVLPFENLGPNEHAYFADGITEEITSRLSAVNGLGVISRTSAVHYAKTNKTCQQIGEELGVDYILEGSVRWAKSADGSERVRITPQLINVADDMHIWAESYERLIDDIFKIQTKIAQKVVENLGVTLLDSEEQITEIQPTQNIEAYHAYLRGRHFAAKSHFSIEDWNKAIQNYQQAVMLDTTFALAYAELARAHARFYYLRTDLSDKRLRQAKMAANKALELGLDNPEVSIALGYYYLWAERDQKKALTHLNFAGNHLPNNVGILKAKAAIFEPQGNWQDYILALEKAIEISPRDASNYTDLSLGLWFTKQYRKSTEACDQAIALAPEETWPYLYKAFTLWSWKGANEESRDALKTISIDHEWYLWSWYWQEVGGKKYQAAQDLLSKTPTEWVRNKMWAMPKSILSAFIFDYLNKIELANENYQTAKALLEKEIQKYPDDPRYHSTLGIAYAALGQKKEAIAEGQKAVELLPLSRDAVYGLTYEQNLAIIYTMLGDHEAAVSQLEYLLSIPCWLSVKWLKMDIRYKPLQTNRRFQELLTKNSRMNNDR